MKIKLAYGKDGLTVDVPEENLLKVLSMKEKAAINDPYIELIKSLLRPIGFENSMFDMALGKKSACIVIPDITRALPNHIILSPILKTLHAAGITKEKITILIATGSHRPTRGEELVELVGEDIAQSYNIINHNWEDQSAHEMVFKSTSGIDVWIDKRYLEADLKIATGLIEPHFMAGFSGGRKSIVPGIAGFETIKKLHGAEFMGHKDSCEGKVDGNPFHEELLAIVKRVGVDLIVNVTLDEDNNITGIFSGDIELAHEAGVEFVRDVVVDIVDEQADVAISTAAGYPLDKTWYQSIKGLTCVMPVIKEGGTIILVSECSEGIGSESFSELLQKYSDLDDFVEDIYNGIYKTDQWQLQKFVAVDKHAKIILVSDKLSKDQADSIHIKTADSVEDALKPLLAENPNLKIVVVPKGPFIIPQLAS